jgi:peptidoglycan/xylan/chitin deacetylase (PgdA/CDA1 family)
VSELPLRGGVALAYHGVDDLDDAADPARLVVSPRRLDAHVRLLRRLGYRFVTAEQALDAGGLRRRTAVLTFDDGWADWLTVALPLLERLGVRASFYVCPGLWGTQHPDVPGEAGRLLDEGEAGRLHAAGMELGAHSLTHRDLRELDDGDLREEVAGSKAAVEDITGHPCRTMAYPFGLHDARVESAVREAGYGLAWAWLPGPWKPLAAPRVVGPPRHGAGRLALKLLGLRRPDRLPSSA